MGARGWVITVAALMLVIGAPLITRSGQRQSASASVVRLAAQPQLISPKTCPSDTRALPADAVAVAAHVALRAERPSDRARILSAGLADRGGPRGQMVRRNCGRRVWRRTVAVAIDLRRYHPSASLSERVSFVARTPSGYVVYALGR